MMSGAAQEATQQVALAVSAGDLGSCPEEMELGGLFVGVPVLGSGDLKRIEGWAL